MIPEITRILAQGENGVGGPDMPFNGGGGPAVPREGRSRRPSNLA